MAEKGADAAKKWEKDRKENAHKCNAAENQKAEAVLQEFHKQRGSHYYLIISR